MPKIIGVKFRNVGKVYYFDPGDYQIHYHDHVIVETTRGIEYGTVVITPTEMAQEKITAPLKCVIRMATEDDDIRERENREHEKEAYRICKQKIIERGLDMKLIEAEYTFDNSKVLFYFTADGRIDFRELVKDLAGIFKTRIELRQIGVRDETKLLGGIGTCGRSLCCHTWLSEFAPVSIKMAKDQNLSLNPAKISGTCGRLMCCLKNEADTYAYLNKGLPGKGDYVTTPDGLHGDVHSVNILRQKVKVIVDLGNDEKELQEFDVEDITFIPKSKRPKKEAPGGSGKQHGEREKEARDERAGKGERSDRAERGERAERPERAERGEKGERPERSERGERAERPERSDKAERGRNPRQKAARAGAEEPLRDPGAGEGLSEEKRETRKGRSRKNRRDEREAFAQREDGAGGVKSGRARTEQEPGPDGESREQEAAWPAEQREPGALDAEKKKHRRRRPRHRKDRNAEQDYDSPAERPGSGDAKQTEGE